MDKLTTSPALSVNKATMIGYTAILMWAAMPVLTKLAGPIPPFQMTAMAFMVGFALSLLKWKITGDSIRERMTLKPKIWALGIMGLFGFHVFYFMAFANAPAIEALLIVDMWPMLIIIFAAMIGKEKLHWWHIVGVLLGFGGVYLITTRNADAGFSSQYITGYMQATVCALIWSLFSVLSKKWKDEIPKDAVGAYCGIAAILSTVLHFFWEPTYILSGFSLFMVFLMGLAPVGAAFFTWDYGVKYGDIKALGNLTYTGLLIGTFLLILFGFTEFSFTVLAAAGLIIAGAMIGSMDMMKRRKSAVTVDPRF